MKFLVIASPFPFTGGGKRIYESLLRWRRFGAEATLFIKKSELVYALLANRRSSNGDNNKILSTLRELEKADIHVSDLIYAEIRKLDEAFSKIDEVIEKKGISWLLAKLYANLSAMKNDIIFAKEFLERENLWDVDGIYVAHEAPVLDGLYFAKSLMKPLVVLLQLEPFRAIKEEALQDFYLSKLQRKSRARTMLRLFLNVFNKYLFSPKLAYKRLLKSKFLAGFLAVSKAPLELCGLNKIVARRRIPVKVLIPSVAVHPKIRDNYHPNVRLRMLTNKEPFAIFFARLNPYKGVLEIPLIAKFLENAGYTLIVAGAFPSDYYKSLFLDKVRRVGCRNIQLAGFLPDDDLWNLVSKARVLVYPSHSDSFSMVVLESLYLGCSVAAYDIPAIKSVYQGLRPVKMVREWDVKELANKAINILSMNEEFFIEEQMDHNLLNFLRLHGSWDNVVKAEISALDEMLSKWYQGTKNTTP